MTVCGRWHAFCMLRLCPLVRDEGWFSSTILSSTHLITSKEYQVVADANNQLCVFSFVAQLVVISVLHNRNYISILLWNNIKQSRFVLLWTFICSNWIVACLYYCIAYLWAQRGPIFCSDRVQSDWSSLASKAEIHTQTQTSLRLRRVRKL